jgi:hypothetical protein
VVTPTTPPPLLRPDHRKTQIGAGESSKKASRDCTYRPLVRGNLVEVFDLNDVYYNEGAPMEWRRWLTPGTAVVLRFEDTGVSIFAHDGKAALGWDEVSQLAVRGPDKPEHTPWPGAYGTNLLIVLLAGLIVHAGSEFRRCWLAFALVAGGEIIFEVENLLREDLERVLEQHSG